MQAEPRRGFRGFFQSRVGRIVLIVIAVGVVFGTYAYVATILAIPVFLLIGLGLPIYFGVKRPRYLAVLGLVVLVAVAPLATVIFSQELLIPPGTASSAGAAPYEVGGSVLQNASVSPFSGTPTTMFTWNVTLYPKFLNTSFDTTNWSNASLDLFVSSCPGATSANLAYCGSGYSFILDLHNFTEASRPGNGTVVTFQARVPADGIWSWQMELLLQNTSNLSTPYKFELVGDPTYDGLEGPIVGGFPVVYDALLVTVYEIDLVYLGIPFYFILVIYMWFKGREARHKDAVARAERAKAAARPTTASGKPPPEGSGSGPPAAGPPGASPPPATSELACPSCGAVIYPNEPKCWKCGASLGTIPNGAPLKSGPPSS